MDSRPLEGRRLSHYRVLAPIGAGSMGVVYRALDERLQREVALKVLPASVAAATEPLKRFRAEAVLLSQLDHPGIATIHEFDDVDGVVFLVMELVAGETLEDRLRRGPLSEREVVRLGAQLAGAVAEAHGRGVIHRDLKPANLRLTADGRLKVLDFGLARLLPADGAARVSVTVTHTGDDAGTLAYMAPEVLAGRSPDPLNDVYAMGIVLYEMSVGRRPYQAEQPMALMYAILNQPAPAPRAIQPSLSPELEAVILSAIERDPAHRCPSARALHEDLLRLEGAAATPAAARETGIRSLAVLPLENLTGDPAQEFFSDGLTDVLIAELAKRRGVRVISRTSVMRYKGVRKPLPEIARELRVDAVVEGSVARSGQRIRVTAQLIHASSDTHLWAESYDRELSDVLALQSELAATVAAEVRRSLLAEDEAAKPAPAAAPPPATVAGRTQATRAPHRVNARAFEAFLKGRRGWHSRSEEGVDLAIRSFSEAVALDPAWAEAHAGLAEAYGVAGFYGYVPPLEAFPLARASALRAQELDDTLGEAHAALGYVLHYHDWRPAEADVEYRRALELSPGSAVCHLWYANLLCGTGRPDEARALSIRGLELDPLAPIMNTLPGWVSFFEREFARAVDEFRRAREVDPSFIMARVWGSWALWLDGRVAEAVGEAEEAVRLSGGGIEPLATLGCACAAAGDGDRARAILRDIEAGSTGRFVSGYFPALLHAALGEVDEALAALDRALAQRSHWLTYLAVDPRLDTLRHDPRFAALERRVEAGG